MKDFLKGGSEYIASLISEAVKNGNRVAAVTGKHEIDKPIRIPSDFTLILDNCHLRLADGSFTNIFVNEHLGTEIGKTLAGRDKNIKIIGRGEAILDGGKYNGLSEKTHLTGDFPEIWNNNMILFANVEGFEIRHIYAKEQRWWAFCFLFCSHGRISDIEFCSNDERMDEEGNIHKGLIKSKYAETCVKNSDGIDLRVGCHDILIEDVRGFTEDDTVALTALSWKLEKNFAVADHPTDIYNVDIRNVFSSAYCSNVRILNQGEHKIHDVYIDGVYDTSESSPHMDRGSCGVKIGDSKSMYGTRPSTADETYNITVRNVHSRALAPISLHGAMSNVVLENVEIFDGGGEIEDLRSVT